VLKLPVATGLGVQRLHGEALFASRVVVPAV